MAAKTQAIPKGYTAVTPYLTIKNANDALTFYKKAFGAQEIGRLNMPDGAIGHAEIEIGGAKIMISEENRERGNLSPQSLGGSPIALCLYVEDVDSVFSKALNEGAKVVKDMEVKDQYWGDRGGTLTDPFGFNWSIMTHIEDVSMDEMQKRTNEMFAQVKTS